MSLAWVWSKFGHMFGDETYLKIRFLLLMGKKLNLKEPKTFSEKLQWLKLYDRRPEYTMMVDKFAVKEYVAKRVGEEFVIPTIGVWDNPDDIEWDKLPSQFVLKTTHGGGSHGVVICKDKNSLDKEKSIRILKRNMIISDWKIQMEWPYKNVPHKILAEEYIKPTPNSKDLIDYKWYCFNGEPKFCQVIQNRTSNETIDFFDTGWRHQKFVGFNPIAKNAIKTPNRPKQLLKQIDIAQSLSKGIPFSRIDLYEIDERVLFGEITLYPMGGMGEIRPEEYDCILGEMIVLPKSNIIK